MWRSGVFGRSLAIFACLIIQVATAAAADPISTRPYSTIFIAGIDRVLDLCEVVFDAVDRPDLAKSLDDRLSGFRHLAGIDRSKPLGLMTTWNETEPTEILFFPVEDLDEFLKTATFGVVGYHQVTLNHFEIERPGTPYHCVVRKDYAFLADSTEAIHALQVTPEQLTRGNREQYEAAFQLDLKQIPVSIKKRYVQGWREQLEPWLQPIDDEEPEAGRLRKAIGKLALDAFERVVLDTETGIIGAHLDPKTRDFRLDVAVTAKPGSPMALGMNRWGATRSELVSLVSPDVPAGIALNLPLGGIVDQILGTEVASAQGSRIEMALQLAGSGLGDLSLIAALHGADVTKLNDALPDLVMKFEKSGWLVDVREGFETHDGVVLHAMVSETVPEWVTRIVGPEPEIVAGQGGDVVWLAIGRTETLVDRLCDAIDSVEESISIAGGKKKSAPMLRARFQAKKLPELVASDLLLPKADQESARAAFADGQDGFSVTIEPVENGVRLRIEAEEGFVRLIGRDWVKQVESASPR